MKLYYRTALFIVLLSLAACSGSDSSETTAEAKVETQAFNAAEVVEIGWEQLMPKGEEQRLEQLYIEYYAELERQFREQSAQSNSGESDGDGDDGTLDIVSAIMEGSAADTMDQIGTFNVVEELNGKSVRIPGYVVPFDFSAESDYLEFLLVPYFGACLHTPPPPPNQIVYVKANPAAKIEDIYEPVWVEGVLKTGEFNSELANTAYELVLDKVEAYAY